MIMKRKRRHPEHIVKFQMNMYASILNYFNYVHSYLVAVTSAIDNFVVFIKERYILSVFIRSLYILVSQFCNDTCDFDGLFFTG